MTKKTIHLLYQDKAFYYPQLGIYVNGILNKKVDSNKETFEILETVSKVVDVKNIVIPEKLQYHFAARFGFPKELKTIEKFISTNGSMTDKLEGQHIWIERDY